MYPLSRRTHSFNLVPHEDGEVCHDSLKYKSKHHWTCSWLTLPEGLRRSISIGTWCCTLLCVLLPLWRFPNQDEQPLNNSWIVMRSRYSTLVSCCFSPNRLTKIHSRLLNGRSSTGPFGLAKSIIWTVPEVLIGVYQKCYFDCTRNIIWTVPEVLFVLYQMLYDPSLRQYCSIRASFCCWASLPIQTMGWPKNWVSPCSMHPPEIEIMFFQLIAFYHWTEWD